MFVTLLGIVGFKILSLFDSEYALARTITSTLSEPPSLDDEFSIASSDTIFPTLAVTSDIRLVVPATANLSITSAMVGGARRTTRSAIPLETILANSIRNVLNTRACEEEGLRGGFGVSNRELNARRIGILLRRDMPKGDGVSLFGILSRGEEPATARLGLEVEEETN